MNYLRGSLTAAYQYYRDLPPINPATLTGAIDVIVIQRQDENGDTELACSPFHVRFGKWQILRPAEKKVNVMVNGRPIPFNMKIGEAGEAFFVFETEEDVPADLMTSPILQAISPAEASGPPQQGGRFGAKGSDPSDITSESKEIINVNEEQDEKLANQDMIPEPDFLDLDAISTSAPKDAEVPPLTKLPPSVSAEPTTALAPDQAINPPYATKADPWNVAEAALQAVKEEEKERVGQLKDKLIAAQNLVRNSTSSSKSIPPESDIGDEVLPKHKDVTPPPVAHLDGVVIDMAGYHSKEASDRTIIGHNRTSGFNDMITTSAARKAQEKLIRRQRGNDMEMAKTEETTPTSSRAQSPELILPGTSISVPVQTITQSPEHGRSAENSPPQYSWEWGAFPIQTPLKSSFPPHSAGDHERPTSAPPSGEHNHMEELPLDVMGEEDFDIDFRRGARLTSAGEYSYVLEFKGQRTTFDLSLCGDLSSKDPEDAQALFLQNKVPFQRFIEEPAIVHKDELTVRWRGRYISRKQSSPILAALVVWRQAALGSSIVQSDEEPLSSSDEREQRPQGPKTAPVANSSATTATTATTGGRWSRWFSRSRTAREPPVTNIAPSDGPSNGRPGLQASSSAPDTMGSTPSRPISPDASRTGTPTDQPLSGPAVSSSKHYVKTLRLTSDQLKELKLKKGPNSITFSLSATGVATCTARIFVWDATDQIVISDIDGTITKSDALGHVFTMIGRDWTHLGVAKLYTDICRNGYKIMYLTSRAIGQADSTRDYLRGINQNNYQLPEGPVVMSPDRLIASLHREVIMRQPEVFKMACLRDIQRLFESFNRNPFYAGFGNRITDALSYRSVNVPSGRIFTIDSTGEVKMELLELAGYKSSYIHMTDLVDQMFPPIHRKWAPEYTDVNFWRQPIQEFDFPELTAPTPPSPALSARSDASMQSGLSRLRNFSLRGSSTQQFVPPSTSRERVLSTGSVQQHQRAKSSVGGTLTPNGVLPGHTRHTSAGDAVGLAVPNGKRNGRDENTMLSEQKARHRMSGGSMPGSYEDYPFDEEEEDEEEGEEIDDEEEGDDEEDDEGDYSDEEGEEELPLEEVDHGYEEEVLGAMDDIPFL
ncbi:hypothetical protein FRB91_000151 [Serendipita sp. 411]|nr:hypothetical protein FRC19_006223 [Serendipita sp. 401]KAG8860955.1 hypothetical protein FRB91_000151 [Serendipita sp. 411]KAG9054497.1 hypothetical protein FS842_004954 [Serendipita sp. 407]